MSTTYYGALPDNFSIDSDGGANYVIPIELPPGTAKMLPSISLGWQLLGISAITRVKATPAQDNFHGTINYDENESSRMAAASPFRRYKPSMLEISARISQSYFRWKSTGTDYGLGLRLQSGRQFIGRSAHLEWDKLHSSF